ncbi:hypothetical protein ALP18_200307 [Pseudomonas amygdali pv. myricae]|nr:hypothetical protein ALP18_200307 [Pseudomonas amygdali pv. myricae]
MPRGLGQAAHAPKKIQLKVRDAHRCDGKVLAVTLIGSRIIEVLTVTLDACGNRRETIGTGYASHRPGFIHSQQRHAKIAVERQG